MSQVINIRYNKNITVILFHKKFQDRKKAQVHIYQREYSRADLFVILKKHFIRM